MTNNLCAAQAAEKILLVATRDYSYVSARYLSTPQQRAFLSAPRFLIDAAVACITRRFVSHFVATRSIRS